MVYKTNKKVVVFCSVIVFIFHLTSATDIFTCETPDAWLSADSSFQRPGSSENVAYLNTLRGMRWLDGKVKYTLDRSLNHHDKQEVSKAMAEYHAKTCVRFEPKQSSDPDYVNIEIDNSVCGVAQVCRIGGKQFARIGKNCRSMPTIVHELGHTLCLHHEHQRMDRHKYLNFRDCPEDSVHPKIPYSTPSGLYDYQSIMHYQCNSCKAGWPTQPDVQKCGMDVNNGLSVLDADHINEMYNCQGMPSAGL